MVRTHSAKSQQTQQTLFRANYLGALKYKKTALLPRPFDLLLHTYLVRAAAIKKAVRYMGLSLLHIRVEAYI